MRHQRVLVVDDRDRTMCITEQPGTDRTHQPARPSPTSAATGDYHLRVFGQVDQRGNGCRRQDFSVDLSGTSMLSSLFDDLECVVDQSAPMILVPAR